MSSEARLSQLNQDAKLTAFEADRTRLVHEETCRVLTQTQIDNEKLTAKLDVRTHHQCLLRERKTCTKIFISFKMWYD